MDLNHRPAVYKTAALTTELQGLILFAAVVMLFGKGLGYIPYPKPLTRRVLFRRLSRIVARIGGIRARSPMLPGVPNIPLGGVVPKTARRWGQDPVLAPVRARAGGFGVRLGP